MPSHNSEDTVWGIAYKIKQEDSEQVTQHLDFREKNGYTRKSVVFYPQDPGMQQFSLTLYIASEDNESYAGKFISLIIKSYVPIITRHSVTCLSICFIDNFAHFVALVWLFYLLILKYQTDILIAILHIYFVKLAIHISTYRWNTAEK